MRPRRLILALCLAAACAPGVLFRVTEIKLGPIGPIAIRPLAQEPVRAGPLTLEAVWHFDNRSGQFGGFSSLAHLGDRIVSASDGGRLLTITMRGDRPVAARLRPFVRRGGPEAKLDFDLEGMTRDGAGRNTWFSIEQSNSIARFDGQFRNEETVRPPVLAHWSGNGGPEAIVRLTDGRFLLVSEDQREVFDNRHAAVRFAADPVDPATPPPERFTVAIERGFAPVDMAQLPDGRVLILLRRLTFPFPPRFASAIAIADPATIRPGRTWRTRLLTRFPAAWPSENYEGLAVRALPDGTAQVWVISDDNEMHHVQRTLLLKLRLRLGHAKGARGPAARP